MNLDFTDDQYIRAVANRWTNAESILRHLYHTSEFDLRLDAAEKTWPWGFSLKAFVRFAVECVKKLDKFAGRVKNPGQSITQVMWSKFPGTDTQTFREMVAMAYYHISDQNPPLINFINTKVLPRVVRGVIDNDKRLKRLMKKKTRQEDVLLRIISDRINF